MLPYQKLDLRSDHTRSRLSNIYCTACTWYFLTNLTPRVLGSQEIVKVPITGDFLTRYWKPRRPQRVCHRETWCVVVFIFSNRFVQCVCPLSQQQAPTVDKQPLAVTDCLLRAGGGGENSQSWIRNAARSNHPVRSKTPFESGQISNRKGIPAVKATAEI